MTSQITIGSRVRTGVYVCGEWVPMWLGVVIAQSSDLSTSQVDSGSLHGAAPWVHWESTSHLRLDPESQQQEREVERG